MYHYIDDKKFISRLKQHCGKIMQSLCHNLKEEFDIGANFYLVGSGAKNLIMQNEANPIDLDYNLEIVRCEDINDCRYLKECTIKAFNLTLQQFGWGNCRDSTSSLTTEKRYFTEGNQTPFSIDVCITARDNTDNYYRLIHIKTGWVAYDEYYWNIAQNSTKIKAKADYIKSKGKWNLVREQYKRLKNNYLTLNDHNHPSFVCYIEAVNNVYNSREYWFVKDEYANTRIIVPLKAIY